MLSVFIPMHYPMPMVSTATALPKCKNYQTWSARRDCQPLALRLCLSQQRITVMFISTKNNCAKKDEKMQVLNLETVTWNSEDEV